MFFWDVSDSCERGTPLETSPEMPDTISRVEAWLSVFAGRWADRSDPSRQLDDEAARHTDRAEQQRAHELAAPAYIPLDVVLAKRARQFAALSSQASLVDLWTAQLRARPYLSADHCCCEGSKIPAVAGASVESLRRLEHDVTTRMIDTYRLISRTNNGRLIDVVV